MSTQWRMGFAGATGLDYTPLQTVMRLAGVEKTRHPDVFHDVRVMESAVLELMRRNAKK